MNRMTEADKEAGYLAFESLKEQHRIDFEELDRVQAAEQSRRAACFEELVTVLKGLAEFYGEFSASGHKGMSFAEWQIKARNLTQHARAVLAKAKGGEGR